MTVYAAHPLFRKVAAGSAPIDVSSAEQYGTIKYLLSTNSMLSPDSALMMMRRGLQHFNSSDYILLGGDLAAVASMVAIASAVNGGSVALLKWDSLYHEYVPIRVTTN